MRTTARRDLLGQVFHGLHLLVVAYVVLGWLVPQPPVLVFYLLLVPAVAIQWQFNRNSCLLNNLESYVRTGHWRSPGNPEEGAFFLELVHRHVSRRIEAVELNAVIYTAMAVFWGLALGHLLHG